MVIVDGTIWLTWLECCGVYLDWWIFASYLGHWFSKIGILSSLFFVLCPLHYLRCRRPDPCCILRKIDSFSANFSNICIVFLLALTRSYFICNNSSEKKHCKLLYYLSCLHNSKLYKHPRWLCVEIQSKWVDAEKSAPKLVSGCIKCFKVSFSKNRIENQLAWHLKMVISIPKYGSNDFLPLKWQISNYFEKV